MYTSTFKEVIYSLLSAQNWKKTSGRFGPKTARVASNSRTKEGWGVLKKLPPDAEGGEELAASGNRTQLSSVTGWHTNRYTNTASTNGTSCSTSLLLCQAATINTIYQTLSLLDCTKFCHIKKYDDLEALEVRSTNSRTGNRTPISRVRTLYPNR